MSTVSDRAILSRIWVLMLTVFVDMLGFLMVLPLLPFYAKDLGASASTIGLLVASFSMAQLTTSPLWGRLSDRWGRKPVLLIALFSSVIAYLVFAVADSIWMLLLCRVAQGAGGGTTGVVQAYISDAVVPESRAKALGWLSAATNAGVMIGPAIGSLAAGLGPHAPGLVAAALCLLNVVSAWRFLPESSVRRSGVAADGVPARKRGSLRVLAKETFRNPRAPVPSMIWIYSLGMLAFMGMNGVLALYLGARFGITAKTIGWFYVYVGGASLVMRTLLLGPAVRRFGEHGVIRLGLGALAAGLLLMPVGRDILSFAVAVLLIPVGTALLFPATSSLLSRFAVKEEVGQTLGLQQTFGGVARMIGPIAGGFAFQHLGISSPFWAGSALMVGTGLFARGLRLAEIAPDPNMAPAPTAISAVAEVGSDSES
jgi:multidrug resistance protein